MSKCPYCKSANLDELNYWNHARDYVKTEGSRRSEGTFKYEIVKNLCLDCGTVFESMSKEALQAYTSEKEYFVK